MTRLEYLLRPLQVPQSRLIRMHMGLRGGSGVMISRVTAEEECLEAMTKEAAGLAEATEIGREEVAGLLVSPYSPSPAMAEGAVQTDFPLLSFLLGRLCVYLLFCRNRSFIRRVQDGLARGVCAALGTYSEICGSRLTCEAPLQCC